jgi:hypothetical protein
MLLSAAGVMLLTWCIAKCARQVLEIVEYSPPAWLAHFAYGVGTRSVFAWSLALFALLPFELLLLSRFDSTEQDLLLWMSWLYFGFILISRPKTPVVFLRRFGLTRSNDVTRRAFARYLRGTCRLLTLDDRRFAATPFRLRDAGSALAMAVLVAVSFVTASQKSCDRGVQADLQRAEYVSFGKRLAYDVMASIYMELVWLAAIVAAGGIVVASGLVWWSRRTITIRSASEVFRLSWLVHWLRSRAWSPSLTIPTIVVINVAHNEWQSAVKMLIRTGASVLIDVSRPGEGLLWELAELMKSDVPVRLIAESHELQQWRHARNDHQTQQLSAAIGDRSILEYDASSGRSARDLARRLSANFPSAGRSRVSFRFAVLACLTSLLYVLITIEIIPCPRPVADSVNALTWRYLGFSVFH